MTYKYTELCRSAFWFVKKAYLHEPYPKTSHHTPNTTIKAQRFQRIYIGGRFIQTLN